MDKGQCQNFWARNSEFGLYPYFLWGARKREAKNWGLGTVPEICPGNSGGRGGGGLAG